MIDCRRRLSARRLLLCHTLRVTVRRARQSIPLGTLRRVAWQAVSWSPVRLGISFPAVLEGGQVAYARGLVPGEALERHC